MLKHKEESMLDDAEKIKKRWKEHNESLNPKDQMDQQPFQPMLYDQGPLLMKKEVKQHVKLYQRRKPLALIAFPLK